MSPDPSNASREKSGNPPPGSAKPWLFIGLVGARPCFLAFCSYGASQRQAVSCMYRVVVSCCLDSVPNHGYIRAQIPEKSRNTNTKVHICGSGVRSFPGGCRPHDRRPRLISGGSASRDPGQNPSCNIILCAWYRNIISISRCRRNMFRTGLWPVFNIDFRGGWGAPSRVVRGSGASQE